LRPAGGARLDLVTDGDPIPTRSSTLPPLRWLAEEDLVYDAGLHTLHRPQCPRVRDAAGVIDVPAGSAIELI
jgi:hypothetical protein